MIAMVLGARGMLGRALVQSAPSTLRLIPLGRHELDITDSAAVRAAVIKHDPAIILNAAAFTTVDLAETDPEAAFRTNALAVTELGQLAAARGVRVVHFSTDYVFDGNSSQPYEESAVPHPINVYGLSKLQGEVGLQTSGAASLIIRTQWLFGLHGRCFPRVMWARARQRTPTQVVDDQFGCPTYTVDLAPATWLLILKNAEGICHLANSGIASWFDVAQDIFAGAGCSDLVRPCRTVDFPSIAPRPAFAPLSTGRAAARFGVSCRPWREALAEFLGELSRDPS